MNLAFDFADGPFILFKLSRLAIKSMWRRRNVSGGTICGAVSDRNVLGCQFQSEEKGAAGLNILRNFIRI
jgi:imidazoleglycerol phosphate synthase glutamine amidotransferase subunit HisH